MNTKTSVREPERTLNGEWAFRIDPEDVGETDGWQDLDATWPDACNVSVPHSWQEEDDLLEYTGTAWYRRTVSFDGPDDGERALLHFGAVDYEATVWVNGVEVGRHRDGYLPFTLDATDAFEHGENTVVLRVHDPRDLSEIPHGKQGDPWYTRVSGPWQSVELVTVPDEHVECAEATPDLADDTARVDVEAAAPDGTTVTVEAARNGETVACAEATVAEGAATLSLDFDDPMYWTPDDPARYDLTVELVDGDDVLDAYTESFGMRSVSYEGNELRLNGEPFEMRGVLDQAFYPETYYRPCDLETFEYEIRTAKNLGFNLLRKHIKPAHPRFLERADELGMLVWEEPANPTRYTERSKRELRDQLEGMIARDYNHPSVVAWSLYNEEWGIGAHGNDELLWTDAAKQDYLENLYYETRERDPTRLVCDNSGWAHVATDLNDFHEYFVAPDRLDAWRDRLDDMIASPADNYGDVRTTSDVPLLISEFGTWGFPDIERLRDADGADPHWFEHDFLEGMKRPAGVREHFEAGPLPDVFDGLDDLAAAWQRREFESLEPIITDMRERDGVAGYVLTELSDTEWEFNGVLDYERGEKSLHDDFVRLNAPVMVSLDLDAHAAWNGDELQADVVVANGTDERVETTATWSAFGEDGTLAVVVPAYESVRYEDAVVVETPAVESLTGDELAVTLDGHTAAREVWTAPDGANGDGTRVYAEDDGLAAALAERDYEVVADASAAAVAFVTDPNAYPDATCFVVPDADGALAPTDAVEYVDLPRDESWNLCACFLYQDLLPVVDAVPGWAFEGLYPYGYATDLDAEDDVAVGYTEGWLENGGAAAFTRPTGDLAGVCTLRVTDTYGEHPVATSVLDELVEAAAIDRREAAEANG